MSEADIMQMMNMLKSGISTSQIFCLLASQACGYECVGYGPRDMYNEIAWQRRQVPGDAARALKKLEDMRLKDPPLYFKACHDSRGLLRNLFWSNGISQLDYQLFGDVIALDTTYKKNKYSCPLVIFSEGKTPTSIITDGAMAIRNTVKDVFSEVRHRLCAWYLIRNVTSNVGNPNFPSNFKKIMMGDYEIPVFKRKWVQLIEEFGLEDNPWVNNMYEEKHIWATAYIREHFQRCVAHLRFKEFNADYESTRGAPVIQTCIELLERFAAETKKVKSAFNDASGFTRDAVVISRQSALMEFSKQLASIAAKVPERFEETRDIIMGLYSSYKAQDNHLRRSSNVVVFIKWKDIDNNVMEDEANGLDNGNMYTEPTPDLDSDN
ncbi:protein FAR1-RELATED SEQUENCE 5-like [Arachis ipaensis]|uniref:protein FAR1-RELATED SEQUENCE 5-like n=1 Tax=Arachis ipaensis TaxID=130454 RepID=UPI0007AFC28B|nr:protein FAR1-RELATED SEQUENCE 5-like [Arachis ipaensis]XP_025647880.1 protein FAR1-RELATED SEQUENCE 5-like [Arachis hypogaea]